ncbi:hypothetical protein JZ751_006574 [Albula glossodonta]|uniref:Centromere protein H C-terminal domain-containing protein n=1 Tax=Albula glossodonta TaxID=121402 RepID=A0A8T2NE36_9TELE|nr:hypothetical protein JZ751_006574 [Albula glossodonta]
MDICAELQEVSTMLEKVALLGSHAASDGKKESSPTDLLRSDYEKEIEEAKINHCNKTLALHRMLVWHAVSEQLKHSDTEADALRASICHTLDLSSRILKLQQESSDLHEQISQLQKQKLELKRLTHERMQELDELNRVRQHPEEGRYSSVLQKGQSVLEKHQKSTTIIQNVLRGVILASRLHWGADPKLRDLTLGLDSMPD